MYVVNNNQELKMIPPNEIHSPLQIWSYHSNWRDDLFPPHIIPLPPFNSYQSQLGLGHFGIASSRKEVPLVVPETPSPNIPNQESRPTGFGRGRGRGVWVPPGNRSPIPGHRQGFGQGLSNRNDPTNRG